MASAPAPALETRPSISGFTSQIPCDEAISTSRQGEYGDCSNNSVSLGRATTYEALPRLTLSNCFPVTSGAIGCSAEYVALAAFSILRFHIASSREPSFLLDTNFMSGGEPSTSNRNGSKSVASFAIPFESRFTAAQYCNLIREQALSIANDTAPQHLLSAVAATAKSDLHALALVSIYRFYGNSIQDESIELSCYLYPAEVHVPYHMQIVVSDSQVRINASFNAQPSTGDDVRRTLQNFEHIFYQLSRSPHQPISQVSLVSPFEFATLQSWNSFVPPRSRLTIPQIFESWVRKQRDKQAVCAWDGNLSYEELDSLSTGLALRLQTRVVTPRSYVPVFVGSSKFIVVAILAISKIGAAFALMDCTHPPARLRKILGELDPKVVLVSVQHEKLVASLHSNIVTVEEKEAVEQVEITTPIVATKPVPSDPAYVTFTSGTTGVPKGIITSHASYCTSALASGPALHMKSSSRVLSFAPYAFDASITETLTVLLLGATVCFPRDDEHNSSITGAIARMDVNWVLWTPSFAKSIPPFDLPSVETLLTGGECPTSSVIEAWKPYPSTTLINVYGVSECAIWNSAKPNIRNSQNITNIGRPFGCAFWIVDLNDSNRLLPIGATGELLIAGPVLADEYLNNPERTAHSFIDAPTWLPEHEGKLYRTGDLARYENTGEIIYMGRADTQVNIGGERIELGEVETGLYTSLARDSRVTTEIAVETYVKADDSTGLVAFLVKPTVLEARSDKGQILKTPKDLEWFRNQVRKIKESDTGLTATMLPSLYIPLNAMPIATTGKLDRSRLRSIVASLHPDEFATFSEYNEGRQHNRH